MIFAARRAGAAPYVFKDRYTTTVFSATMYLAAATHTFKTANLSVGTDPVLNVWNGSTSVAFNDDCPGTAPNSCVTFPISTPGWYTIYVHAYRAYYVGTGDVIHEQSAPYAPPQTIGVGVTFGGDSVSMSAPAATYRYETALSPGGVADTMLFATDCLGKLLALDDDSGVGLSSRLTGYNYCNVVVAAYAWSGYAHLYVNDYGTDSDGDGLGNSLEAELGTCDITATGYCLAYPSVVKSFDTDRDGLSDSAEVFGVDDASYPVYLPRWGADPRHKDVFLEYDWDTPSKPTGANGSMANSVQAYFNPGSASDLQNPDGTGGVRMHLDIGVSYPGQTVYGDWGGSSGGSPPTLLSSRFGLFRQVIASSSVWPSSGFGAVIYVGDDGGAWSIAHESGHHLNLSHGGCCQSGWAHTRPSADINYKPNYASLMNYGGAEGATKPDAFSLGLKATIEASSISESDSWPAPQAAPPYPWSPYFFLVSGRTVDWNRDGVIEPPGVRVRGGPTHTGQQEQGRTARAKAQALSSGPFLATSPKLVKRGGYLYTFYGSTTTPNTLYVRWAAVGGADGEGSCTGSSSLTSTTPCSTFNPLELPVSLGDNISGFSAYEWGGGIIVAFRTTAGALKSVFTNTFLTTPGWEGAPGPWSSPRDHGVTTTTEPELTIMYTSSGDRLGLVYVTSGARYHWLAFAPTTLDGTSAWTDMGDIKNYATLAGIGGTLSPSFAAWPSRTLATTAVRRTCGVFGDAGSTGSLSIFCQRSTDEYWTELDSIFSDAELSDRKSNAKTSLAYHVLRNDAGTPLAGDGQGQFWLTTIRPCYGGADCPHYRVSYRLDKDNPPNGTTTRFKIYGTPDDEKISSLLSGTGVQMFEDGSMSALKAAWIINVGGTDYQLWSLPLFDGTFKGLLVDNNDFQIMERGICSSLHPASYEADCGLSSPWGY